MSVFVRVNQGERMNTLLKSGVDARAESRKSLLIISILCFSCLPLISMGIFGIFSSVQKLYTLLLLGLLIIVIIFPFIVAWSQGRNADYLEIIYPLSIVYLLNYVIRTIYVITNPHDLYVLLRPWLLYSDLLNLALFYVIIGFSSLLIGYYSSIPKKLTLSLPLFFRKEWPEKNRLGKIFILYFFGVFIYFFSLSYGYNPSSVIAQDRMTIELPLYDYLNNFSDYMMYAFFIGLITKAFAKKEGKLLGWITGSILLLRYLLGQSKNDLVIYLFLFIVMYNYRHRYIKLKPFIILSLITFFFFFPWINTYRGILGQKYLKRASYESYTGATSLTIRKLLNLRIDEYINYALTLVMERQQSMDRLASIIAQTPQPNPYLLGYDFITIPCNLIPTFIWTEKPRPEDGKIFDFKYWHSSFQGNAGATFIGDLYMNFGIYGIIIGMFMAGIFIRFIYLYLVKFTHGSSPGLFYYMIFLTSLPRVMSEGEIGSLGHLLKLSVYYLFIIHIFMKKI